jgi:Xaa-Pro dipeptidase
MGNDSYKKQLATDSEKLWHIANEYFIGNPAITGAQLYEYCTALAVSYGWEFGGPIAGHFPHESLETEVKTNYIHLENHISMNQTDSNGKKRHWIIEIHLIGASRKIGAFFEQLAGF